MRALLSPIPVTRPVAARKAPSVTSKFDSASDGASDATQGRPPTSTVGSGRDDVDVKSSDEDNQNDGIPTGTRKFESALTTRILRIPRKDELPKSGLPDPLFHTTVEIQVPTLAESSRRRNAGLNHYRSPVPPSGTQDESRGSSPPTVEPPAGASDASRRVRRSGP